MTDTVVQLGEFAFQDFEVPESIPFGGSQVLAKHKLVGADRVFDAMGADEDPIEWSGRFRGGEAEARAQALDAMRREGRALPLTWAGFAFTVVISRFKADYRRKQEIPYTLTVEVIAVDHDPARPGTGPTVDEMVQTDLATATGLAGRIADGPLSSLVAGVQTAVAGVSNFATAAQSAISGVLAPIAAVQSRVSGLIGTAEAALGGSNFLGGVFAGGSPGAMAASLLAQAGAASHVADLYDLQSVMGRMAKNLTTIGSSGTEVVTAGGDLMKLAARAYGDATEWSTIAQANGLTDPVLRGVKTILVPPVLRGLGGVLGG